MRTYDITANKLIRKTRCIHVCTMYYIYHVSYELTYLNKALRRKGKDWLAWNRDNVSEWGNESIRELLFQ